MDKLKKEVTHYKQEANALQLKLIEDKGKTIAVEYDKNNQLINKTGDVEYLIN